MDDEFTDEQSKQVTANAKDLIFYLRDKHPCDYTEIFCIIAEAYALLGITIYGPTKLILVTQKMQKLISELEPNTKA